VIFLSHNFKDKEIVEPIAVRLKRAYGVSNVFYDSWSISPGDNIIGKMNTGLDNAEYFFYFISENSLKSKMVDLEWQSALFKMSKDNIKFIPVKIDKSIPPTILLSTLYIDMYSNGFEVALRQIFDVINDTNTKEDMSTFSNLKVSFYDGEDNNYVFQLEAKYFYEPNTRFILCYSNLNEEIEFKILTDSVNVGNEINNWELNNGLKVNGRYFSLFRGVEPKFPIRISLKHKNNLKINDVLLMWAVKENQFEQIPISYERRSIR